MYMPQKYGTVQSPYCKRIPCYLLKPRQYFELVTDVQEAYTDWNNHKCKEHCKVDLGEIYMNKCLL